MYKFFKYFSYVLAIFGAINWGLIGFFDFDVVSFLFGEMSTISRIIYSIIGVCAIYNSFVMYNNLADDEF